MKPLKTDYQRLWDLVRYSRAYLMDKGLLTQDEYTKLAMDHDAVARLEKIDAENRCRHGVWFADYCYSCKQPIGYEGLN